MSAAPWIIVDKLGKLQGQSGRKYTIVGVEGSCATCGTPFGLRAAVDKADLDPVYPRVRFVHDADAEDGAPPVHHLEMTGDSEAARALRDGRVIARHAEEVQP